MDGRLTICTYEGRDAAGVSRRQRLVCDEVKATMSQATDAASPGDAHSAAPTVTEAATTARTHHPYAIENPRPKGTKVTSAMPVPGERQARSP